jgi:plasmid stability protein
MVASMRTITLKNVPEAVHKALKRQAKHHKRSLNQEAIFCLDQALSPAARDPQTFLEEVRRLRSSAGVKEVSLDLILKTKRRGLP